MDRLGTKLGQSLIESLVAFALVMFGLIALIMFLGLG